MRLRLGWRWAALKNGFQDATVYRSEFLFDFLGSALVPALIQWVLWFALFQIGGAKEVAGLTYTDMIQYTFASVLFNQIRGGNHDFDLDELIRTGQLSNYLLRPVGAVEFVYIRGVAVKLFLAVLCFAIGATVGSWFGIAPGRMAGAMALALIGNIIHYQIGAALASAAFYWEEAYSVLMVKNMVVSLLSGELIPLTLFPESMAWIWKAFPFYLYVFGPTQVALGRWSTAELFQNLLIGALWMGVGWFLIRVSWRIGIRHYSSIGG